MRSPCHYGQNTVGSTASGSGCTVSATRQSLTKGKEVQQFRLRKEQSRERAQVRVMSLCIRPLLWQRQKSYLHHVVSRKRRQVQEDDEGRNVAFLASARIIASYPQTVSE
jgi:hypothetical protein